MLQHGLQGFEGLSILIPTRSALPLTPDLRLQAHRFEARPDVGSTARLIHGLSLARADEAPPSLRSGDSSLCEPKSVGVSLARSVSQDGILTGWLVLCGLSVPGHSIDDPGVSTRRADARRSAAAAIR
jgi:hypothetical protein